LTNLSGLSSTNQIVFTNNTTWFDTNGAGIAAAKAATNGFTGGGGNATNAQPPSSILTNLSGLSSTNQIVFTNNTTWFDTNGAAVAAAKIATNNLAIPSTNGFVTASITNGLAFTNAPFSSLNFSGYSSASKTGNITGFLLFTNGGTTYSVYCSTNLP
jgi:hypothetical protein